MTKGENNSLQNLSDFRFGIFKNHELIANNTEKAGMYKFIFYLIYVDVMSYILNQLRT